MPSELERRILVYAPTRKDSQLTCQIFGEREIECLACDTVADMVQEMDRGVGALILAEEDGLGCLA